MNVSELDKLYDLYRFKLIPQGSDSFRVYALRSKYFSNADIVVLDSGVSKEAIKKISDDVQSMGFSVAVRYYKYIEDVEKNLFDGFFDVAKSNEILLDGYNDYTKKIEDVILGRYEYVQSQYFDYLNDQYRTDSLITRILNDFSQDRPVLVMLEAAAGFGKTSTSYEVLKNLSSAIEVKQVPLFTELSRNRQASIFKYVLYDEINRRFTGVNLEVVIKHINDGRIPLIIDGFDELLKPKSKERTEDTFEDAEPMLETIKELLVGRAKILLTTRRTAVFSDDDFFEWLDKNHSDFEFRRYSISEPTISDWIPPSREKEEKTFAIRCPHLPQGKRLLSAGGDTGR